LNLKLHVEHGGDLVNLSAKTINANNSKKAANSKKSAVSKEVEKVA